MSGAASARVPDQVRPPAPVRHVGGLAGWQVRRVQGCMEAALARAGKAPSLAELSAVVGLSRAHLCTAFRQSTGLTPHDWWRCRRVARAKALLADPRLPVADVALACGYASASHFVTSFRVETGTTPGAWRRDLRGHGQPGVPARAPHGPELGGMEGSAL